MLWLLVGCASDFDRRLWQIPEHFPTPEVPTDNPMTAEKVELGRHLFYDFRLSENGARSCGVCHEPAKGFTDGFVRAVGATDELHTLNTLSLTDVAWREQLGWRSLEDVDLEHQLLVPLMGLDPLEMGMTEALLVERLEATAFYPPLFDAAFPGQPISVETTAMAIASFQRTLVSGGSEYDLFLLGQADLTPAQERGRALFFGDELKCSRCHGGVFLDSPTNRWGRETDRHGWFNTGLYNVDGQGGYPPDEPGLISVTGERSDMGRFRTPSLRNVELTGPWGHDGTVASLETLLDTYARGGRDVQSGALPGDGADNPYKSPLITGFELSDDQRADVLAFLESLTDWDMVERPALANPWCVTVAGQVVNAPCLEPEPF